MPDFEKDYKSINFLNATVKIFTSKKLLLKRLDEKNAGIQECRNAEFRIFFHSPVHQLTNSPVIRYLPSNDPSLHTSPAARLRKQEERLQK
jgi:hypothetical protein